MKILGIIVMVVGIALVLAGRLVERSLPPGYEENPDEDFLKLLQSVGKVLGGIGIFFLVAGIVIMIVFR